MGAPVKLDLISNTFGVAAGATAFVVTDTTHSQVGVWTGSGVASFTTFAQGEEVSSDGTTLVLASQNGTAIDYATSADGLTWSSSQPTGLGGSLYGVVGGKAGVLVWTASGTTISASLWHAGAWSAVTTLTTTSVSPCQASVADTTAVIACPNATTAAVQLYVALGL